MKVIWNGIQIGFAAVGGWLGWALGGMDGFLFALVAFVVIDYITGVMCAVVDRKLSSEVGFRGIFKKIVIFCMVAVAHIIDTQILGVAGDGSAIRTAVIFFYLANEGLSILENTTRLGLPVPDKLKSILAQLHNKTEAGSGNPAGVVTPGEPSEPGDGEYITPPHPEPGVGTENENETEEPTNENLS